VSTEVFDEAALDALEARIDAWGRRCAADPDLPMIAAVERGQPGQRRWYLRVHGEEKDVFTIWLTLGQRTLGYETYVMPAPEENPAAFYEQLLRRNRKLFGAAFCIGEEDGIFLAGQLPNGSVDDDELDRILGSLYEWTERFFRPALRIGFASRFKD
jgi:hypothetical protein